MQILNKEFESFLFLKGLQPVTVFGHLSGINRILKQCSPEHLDEFVINLYKSTFSYAIQMLFLFLLLLLRYLMLYISVR